MKKGNLNLNNSYSCSQTQKMYFKFKKIKIINISIRALIILIIKTIYAKVMNLIQEIQIKNVELQIQDKIRIL